jgi:hypothetical protein
MVVVDVSGSVVIRECVSSANAHPSISWQTLLPDLRRALLRGTKPADLPVEQPTNAVAVLAAQQGPVPKTLDTLMDRVVTPPPETFGDCRKVRLPNGKSHVRCLRSEGQSG